MLQPRGKTPCYRRSRKFYLKRHNTFWKTWKNGRNTVWLLRLIQMLEQGRKAYRNSSVQRRMVCFAKKAVPFCYSLPIPESFLTPKSCFWQTFAKSTFPLYCFCLKEYDDSYFTTNPINPDIFVTLLLTVLTFLTSTTTNIFWGEFWIDFFSASKTRQFQQIHGIFFPRTPGLMLPTVPTVCFHTFFFFLISI